MGLLLLKVRHWLYLDQIFLSVSVRMVRGSTLTVGNFLSLENLNVIIRAIN